MASPLHVAVDVHNLLHDPRGIGVYLRAVLVRLLARDDLRVTLLVKRLLPAHDRAAIAKKLGNDRFDIANRLPRSADVSWHPWNGRFFSGGNRPSVATIHDVAPFAFPAASWRMRRREQAPFRRSARSTHILTPSNFSRDEMVRYLGVEPEKVTVVPLAADPRFTPGVPTLLPEALRERSYVLFVGAEDPRKNLPTLGAAHRAAFPNGEVALACVTRGAPAGAIEIPEVSFAVLRDLYRGALALAMPSIYEGFGIPPIEAMRCGTPVLASRVASIPEVCGEAALYVNDPKSIEDWSAALERMSRDSGLRADLRERGFAQSHRLTWNRTTDETLAVLRAAAGGS
jgi:glycosyltransferase involved in cell wall biosynthesis